MMERLGIMGGMFDPVHNAHLQVATTACQVFGLNCLHMVPCSIPNHRQGASASAEHRLAMLRLATAGDSQLVVDEREVRRPGVSYMVDTLRSFREEFPHAWLVYVMGADSFASLPHWHQWRAIPELVNLCVVSRQGIAANALPPVLCEQLQQRQVSEAQDLLHKTSGGIYLLSALDLPHSSSVIRQQLQAQQNVSDIPESVRHYIDSHRLYHQ